MFEYIWMYRLLSSQRTHVSMKSVFVTCTGQNSVLVVYSLMGKESIVPFSLASEIEMKKKKKNCIVCGKMFWF